MNGSGTTMLADCINHHPLVYIHPVESRVIPFYYFNQEKFGNLENEANFNKLLKEFSNCVAFRAYNGGLPLDIQVNFTQLKDKNLPTAIDLTYTYFSRKYGKDRWGDHSPKYALFIPELINLFPRAKIIHLIRDGRDCARSFHRRFGQNIYRSITLWKQFVRKAREDGTSAGRDNYFEMKYEDLTNAPEIYMKKVCEFIEVPFDSAVLTSRMPMFESPGSEIPGGTTKSVVPNSGKWKTGFSKDQIRKLEQIGGAALADLGYEVLFCKDDNTPSPIPLSYWKLTDRINATIAFYKKYKGKDLTGAFLQRVKTSLMQGASLRSKTDRLSNDVKSQKPNH